MEHCEHVWEECWDQQVAFITLEDVWLELRRADKALEAVLHSRKPCIREPKENSVPLQHSVTKYGETHHFKNFQLWCQKIILMTLPEKMGFSLFQGSIFPAYLFWPEVTEVHSHSGTGMAFSVIARHSEFLINCWYRRGLICTIKTYFLFYILLYFQVNQETHLILYKNAVSTDSQF